MKFKKWIESNFNAFGQGINSPEEFDKLGIDYYKNKGYSDEDIKRIMQMADADIYDSPRYDKKVWTPFDSPFYKKVWTMLENVLRKEAKVAVEKKENINQKSSNSFFSRIFGQNKEASAKDIYVLAQNYMRVMIWIIADDPVVKSRYKDLHKENVTEQEVQQFFNFVKNIKVFDNYYKKYEKNYRQYMFMIPIHMSQADDFFSYKPANLGKETQADPTLRIPSGI